MKKIFQAIRTWISEFKTDANGRKVQRLHDEAAENIVMREIKYRETMNGKELLFKGYGIFVCGNLVSRSADLTQEFSNKLFELRKMYFDLRNTPSAYTLL